MDDEYLFIDHQRRGNTKAVKDFAIGGHRAAATATTQHKGVDFVCSGAFPSSIVTVACVRDLPSYLRPLPPLPPCRWDIFGMGL